MIKDVYSMNNKTGEILPTMQAIAEFYKTHNALDAWTDEWTPTDIEAENEIQIPNFLQTIKI